MTRSRRKPLPKTELPVQVTAEPLLDSDLLPATDDLHAGVVRDGSEDVEMALVGEPSVLFEDDGFADLALSRAVCADERVGPLDGLGPPVKRDISQFS